MRVWRLLRDKRELVILSSVVALLAVAALYARFGVDCASPEARACTTNDDCEGGSDGCCGLKVYSSRHFDQCYDQPTVGCTVLCDREQQVLCYRGECIAGTR